MNFYSILQFQHPPSQSHPQLNAMKPYETYITSLTLSFESSRHTTLMCNIIASTSQNVLSSSKLVESKKFHIDFNQIKQAEGIQIKFFKPSTLELLQSFYFHFNDIQNIQGFVEGSEKYARVKRGEYQRCMIDVSFAFEPTKKNKKVQQPIAEDDKYEILKSRQVLQLVHYNEIGRKYYQSLVKKAIKVFLMQSKMENEKQNNEKNQQNQKNIVLINQKLKQSRHKLEDPNIQAIIQGTLLSALNLARRKRKVALNSQRVRSICNIGSGNLSAFASSTKYNWQRQKSNKMLSSKNKLDLSRQKLGQSCQQNSNMNNQNQKKRTKRTTIDCKLNSLVQNAVDSLFTTAANTKRKCSSKHVKWDTKEDQADKQNQNSNVQYNARKGSGKQKKVVNNRKVRGKKAKLSQILGEFFKKTIVEDGKKLENVKQQKQESARAYYTSISEILLNRVMKLEAISHSQEKSCTVRPSDRLKLKKKKTNMLKNVS